MTRTTPPQIRRGFSMIEAIVSIAIVSVMLVASLRVVAAARAGQVWNSDRLRAICLAQDLMAEITGKAYVDPGALPLFGPELGELGGGRADYNDVDDYNGLTETPPKDRSGADLPDLSNWTRSVDVARVRLNDLTATSVSDTGIKRITITVSRNGVTLATLVQVRASATPR